MNDEMSEKLSHLKGIIAVIVASILWGTTGTAASLLPNVSVLAIGAFSTGIGGLLLVCVAYKQLINDYPLLLAKPVLVLIGAASVAIYPLAFYSAMKLSGIAIGTIMSIASAPFFAVILEWLLSKKTISLHWLISFIIGTLGVTFLVIGKQHGLDNGNDLEQTTLLHYLGIVLGALAGLTYATYSWVAKHLIDNGVHSKSAMSAQFGLAAMLLLPSLLFTGQSLFSTTLNASVALYMAVIPMFIGYLLFGYSLQLINASQATLITLLEPLIATLLAIIIVGERFKLIGWFGLVLVFTCLVLQTVSFKRTQLKIATALNITD